MFKVEFMEFIDRLNVQCEREEPIITLNFVA